MTVDLTPKGTRGANIPNLPRPLRKAGMGLFYIIVRLRGAPLLTLTTVGSKSGREHRVPLTYFSDGADAWLVVASYGGAAAHPAWYVNMAKNPDKVWITLDQRKLPVRPESLKGAEREAAWRRIVAAAPGYAAYQQQTDREIPVVRLRKQ